MRRLIWRDVVADLPGLLQQGLQSQEGVYLTMEDDGELLEIHPQEEGVRIRQRVENARAYEAAIVLALAAAELWPEDAC